MMAFASASCPVQSVLSGVRAHTRSARVKPTSFPPIVTVTSVVASPMSSSWPASRSAVVAPEQAGKANPANPARSARRCAWASSERRHSFSSSSPTLVPVPEA